MFGEADAARLAAGLVGGGATVTREGAGWDHVAWRVEGADGRAWIVRAATDGSPDERSAEVRREVAVMRLARRALGTVVADAVVLDEALGCMAHPRLDGVPLQQLLAEGVVPDGGLGRLAGEAGGVIARLAALDPASVGEALPVDDDLAAWFAELPGFLATVAPLLSPEEVAAVERFVAAPPPPAGEVDLVLAHNDLGAEHLLVDPGTLAVTGLIDWSDAAVADPAADLGRLVRDLGGHHLEAMLDGMGVTGARRHGLEERAWCYARCLVLEDLAYAVERRPDLVAFERAGLARLYAGV